MERLLTCRSKAAICVVVKTPMLLDPHYGLTTIVRELMFREARVCGMARGFGVVVSCWEFQLGFHEIS